jgi:hypothetical protein
VAVTAPTDLEEGYVIGAMVGSNAVNVRVVRLSFWTTS